MTNGTVGEIQLRGIEGLGALPMSDLSGTINPCSTYSSVTQLLI